MGILPGFDEPTCEFGAFGKLILEGLNLLGGNLIQKLLAAVIEEDEKTAGSALGHLSFGGGVHEGFDDTLAVFEVGFLNDEAAEMGPLKVGAEFVFVGWVGRRDVGGVGVGLTVAEAVEVMVAAVFIALVGGAAAAVAVGENVGTETRHIDSSEGKGRSMAAFP